MIKAVVFDLDGVLVNTEPLFFRAAQLAFQDLNIPFEEKDYAHYWTQKGQGAVDYIKEKNIEVDYPEFRFRAKVYYINSLEEGFEVMAGAEKVLITLHRQLPLGLATSSSRDYLNIIFGKTGFHKYFQTTLAGDEVKNRKPDPEQFLTISEKLQTEPNNVLVIEDAEKGLIAAKKAGMKVVAIPNSYTKDGDFGKADFVLDNLEDVTVNLVKSIKS